MRSRKALVNTIAGLSYELVAVICGFILPKLILSKFGSSYNGMTSSITQFLGYVSLMRAGIGGVTKAALYKPLASGDNDKISAIVNATEKFLKRVSLIFAISLLVFAVIYPFFVSEDFEWFFSFTLVLILGISTFAQYYFGVTYQLLLNADQRQCVTSFVQIGSTILNTIIAAILIKLGSSIHVVKIGSAIVFSLNPIIINMYVRKKYNINKNIAPDNNALSQRWDCFGLQVANFVNSNTDMLLLTIFTNVYEVSVYTVYYMVTAGIRTFLLTFVNSIGAAFGNMFAKEENEVIYENLRLYEQVTFSIANFLFSITAVMILSFISVYTKGITDVNYIRPAFSYILIIATLFSAYRIPYQSIVEVVGRFKETRNGAFFEAAMNIVISVALVNKFGLIGVAIGTLCATIFRTFQYASYMSKHIIKRSLWSLIKRLILSAVQFIIVLVFAHFLNFSQPNGYLEWALQAFIVCLITGFVTIVIECAFYYDDLRLTVNKVIRVIILKKKKISKRMKRRRKRKILTQIWVYFNDGLFSKTKYSNLRLNLFLKNTQYFVRDKRKRRRRQNNFFNFGK